MMIGVCSVGNNSCLACWLGWDGMRGNSGGGDTFLVARGLGIWVWWGGVGEE